MPGARPRQRRSSWASCYPSCWRGRTDVRLVALDKARQEVWSVSRCLTFEASNLCPDQARPRDDNSPSAPYLRLRLSQLVADIAS